MIESEIVVCVCVCVRKLFILNGSPYSFEARVYAVSDRDIILN